MKRLGISLAGQRLEDKVLLAQEAEDAGFEVAWVNDDPGQDTFVAMSLMAAATKRIHVGSGVCRAFIRHPIVTASAASDIQEYSGGRMRLGFSTGTKGQNRGIGLDGDHG